MTECVSIAIENRIARVTLNRPDKHNAVDLAMFEALGEAGRQIATDTSIRAVVLEGAGSNFCAGIDTSLFQGGESVVGPDSMAPRGGSPANLFQLAAYVWREVPVPVICSIAGIAYGAGLQIALGADIRFARPDARFSVMEIKWGLIPDMAISTTLTRCMPADRIKELACTGRVFDGAEACELGLVTALHDDPSQHALDTAQRIAARSPDAVRAIKHLFDKAWNIPDRDALKLEASLQSTLLGGANQVEAVMANIEDRPPDFSDPEA
jgi:enoyl-CoA hydratase/carnithine racemase